MVERKPQPAPAAIARTKVPDKPVPQPAADEGEAAKKEGWLGWTLGWVVAPGAVIGAIFGGGVLLGAHHPDGWFAKSVLWIASLFS